MLTSSSGEKKDLTDSCDQLQASLEKTASSPTFWGADCWINSENNLFYQPGLTVEHREYILCYLKEMLQSPKRKYATVESETQTDQLQDIKPRTSIYLVL